MRAGKEDRCACEGDSGFLEIHAGFHVDRGIQKYCLYSGFIGESLCMSFKKNPTFGAFAPRGGYLFVSNDVWYFNWESSLLFKTDSARHSWKTETLENFRCLHVWKSTNTNMFTMIKLISSSFVNVRWSKQCIEFFSWGQPCKSCVRSRKRCPRVVKTIFIKASYVYIRSHTHS